MSTTFLSFASTLGWVGAIGTVVAYALVSQHLLAATSRTFQGVNAVGAALLTISALAHDSWPSAASNVVWVLIAVVALARSRRLATEQADVVTATTPEPVAGELCREDVTVAA